MMTFAMPLDSLALETRYVSQCKQLQFLESLAKPSPEQVLMVSQTQFKIRKSNA